LPEWLESYEGGATIYEPRRFLLYNPETSAILVENCRNFSVGGELIVNIMIKNSSITVEEPNQLYFIKVPFNWNLKESGSSCYLYKIPVYNPFLVDKTRVKYYPFDSYSLKIGFLFPYKTDFQGLVILPEQFTITSFSINTTQKIVKTISTRNVGYFNFKPIVNETTLFSIDFSRNPDIGRKILLGIILIGLPSVLMTFFLFSSNFSTQRNIKITAFYLSVIPLFFSMLTFLKDKPTSFTLLDVSLTLSVSALILNIVKDFIFPQFFVIKISLWGNEINLKWIIISILVITTVLIWLRI